MDLFKTYTEFLLESKTNEIIVYHKSNSLEHMLECDFKLEKASDRSIFGQAIYFSSSPNTYWGKYNCSFSITLDEPILDLNKEISLSEANKTLRLFIEILSLNSRFRFNQKVQIGQVFEKVNDLCFEDHIYDGSKHFRSFIQDYLKYNSFKYYQNSMTDYVLEEGEFGTAYGIYNPKNIKFVDGPL